MRTTWYKDYVFLRIIQVILIRQNTCIMIVKCTLPTEPLQERGTAVDFHDRALAGESRNPKAI